MRPPVLIWKPKSPRPLTLILTAFALWGAALVYHQSSHAATLTLDASAQQAACDELITKAQMRGLEVIRYSQDRSGFTPERIEKIYQFISDQRTFFGGRPYDADSLEHFRTEFDAHMKGSELIALFNAQGNVVATGAMEITRTGRATEGELQKLYVDPSLRKTGIGTAILRAAETYAGEVGVDHLFLETYSTMKAAHALYEEQGYRLKGYYTESILPPLRFERGTLVATDQKPTDAELTRAEKDCEIGIRNKGQTPTQIDVIYRYEKPMSKEAQFAPRVLETERLILRPIAESDFEAIRNLLNDPEVQKMSGDSLSDQSIRLLISHSLRDQSEQRRADYLTLVIRKKGSSDIIGMIQLRDNHRGDGEMGFALSPTYWNQGIMSEASYAFMSHAFHTLLLNRVFALTSETNAASRAINRKLGFTKIGTQRTETGSLDIVYELKRGVFLWNESHPEK